MIRRIVLAALAAACLSAAPAGAAQRLKPGAVTLDPKLGYVLVRLGPAGKKGKAPLLYIWRFDPALGELRTTRKKDPSPVAKGEDTAAYFGDRVFTPSATASIFISSVTPGDYVIHGTDATCFCLGTYAFTVKPGEITDIGTVMVSVDDKVGSDLQARGLGVDNIVVEPAKEGDPLPPEVATLRLTRAALTPDVRFPNRGPARPLYFGGLLPNRVAALPPPVSGDMKALVDRLVAAKDPEVTTKPIPEEPAKPAADGKAAAPAAH